MHDKTTGRMRDNRENWTGNAKGTTKPLVRINGCVYV